MSESEVDEASWPLLASGESEIQSHEFDGDERSWRNVHPNHHNSGTLTSQVYEPSDGEDGLRSTAREKSVTAETHLQEFRDSGHTSDGVCSLPLSSIVDEGLRWVDDSANVEGVTGHASIDFRHPEPARRTKRQMKKAARNLAGRASWVIGPPDAEEEQRPE